jgi:competence protein ComEA
MKQLIREYLTFNKRERNGIFVLLCIITALIVYLNVSDRIGHSERIDFTKFEKEIQALNAMPVHKDIYPDRNNPTQSNSIPERFRFNPNNLPEQDWKKLGLSDKQIRSIKNYESKGGKFKRKEDLKKMYVISSELYASLESYVDIPSEGKITVPEKITDKQKHVETALLELNSADSVQLTSVKGIGPFFAKNIIKYKNILGGYSSKEQLMEVWKFDKEKYEAIEKYITVDASKIQQININNCTAKELKHPYLTWKIANGIVNYRAKHGNFTALEQIKKTDLITEELFLKMAPYLKLGN